MSKLTVAVSGVLANDLEPDGEPMDAVLLVTTTSGTLDLNDNGSFTYTPDPNFNGVDSFTYQATDGLSNSPVAVVTIDVAPVNDPASVNDNAYVVAEDGTLVVGASLGVLSDDADVEGDPLGLTDGLIDGLVLGDVLGDPDGESLGDCDGDAVGLAVASQLAES